MSMEVITLKRAPSVPAARIQHEWSTIAGVRNSNKFIVGLDNDCRKGGGPFYKLSMSEETLHTSTWSMKLPLRQLPAPREYLQSDSIDDIIATELCARWSSNFAEILNRSRQDVDARQALIDKEKADATRSDAQPPFYSFGSGGERYSVSMVLANSKEAPDSPSAYITYFVAGEMTSRYLVVLGKDDCTYSRPKTPHGRAHVFPKGGKAGTMDYYTDWTLILPSQFYPRGYPEFIGDRRVDSSSVIATELCIKYSNDIAKLVARWVDQEAAREREYREQQAAAEEEEEAEKRAARRPKLVEQQGPSLVDIFSASMAKVNRQIESTKKPSMSASDKAEFYARVAGEQEDPNSQYNRDRRQNEAAARKAEDDRVRNERRNAEAKRDQRRLAQADADKATQDSGDARERARQTAETARKEAEENARREEREREQVRLNNERRERDAKLKAEEERRAAEAARKAEIEAQERRERDAKDNYLRAMTTGIKLLARNCPDGKGKHYIVGVRPNIKPESVGCLDVQYRAVCEGARDGIQGSVHNFLGAGTDCFFGDAAQISPTPACKVSQISVQVTSVTACR